ncbi:MAG TPA: chemotaxis protein CheA [Geobacteraceae bacterium]
MNDTAVALLLEDYLEDAAGHLDAAEIALIGLEKDAREGCPDEGPVVLLLGHLHTLKGNSGMMGFVPLQQFVHTLESVLQSVATSGLAFTGAFFEAFYEAISALRGALKDLAADPAGSLDFSDQLMLLECLALQEADTPTTPLAGGRRDDSGYLVQKSATLRVNFEKLDELMNLVGELVIHRTALLSIEARLKETVKDRQIIEAFDVSSQAIGKTANDLREAIMKVRMLPVRTVFQRFSRLVRDLSHSHGKKVCLVFEGEETELDKTVIDEIGEPLLHLIRNAVDHGIETPAERKKSGKQETGILKLAAAHENNQIVITVEDDGRGISADRLKQAAVANGVLGEGEAGSMETEEALQLVFLPGFSTSSELTETSGRGIGLDVVRKTVSSLNGAIGIESIPGERTRFVMQLPLTLAIIQALMVEVAGQTFAVPLSGVLESIRVDAAEIHQVSSGEIINLRDRLLPVFRLDRLFSLGHAAVRDTEYLVVVGSGEKRGGIVIDRLLGQREIVIKGIDDYLGELPGIAGGTILGDGKVSLVLDIVSLLEKNEKRGRR